MMSTTWTEQRTPPAPPILTPSCSLAGSTVLLPGTEDDSGLAQVPEAAGVRREASGDLSSFVTELRRIVQQLEVPDDSLLNTFPAWTPSRRGSVCSLPPQEASGPPQRVDKLDSALNTEVMLLEQRCQAQEAMLMQSEHKVSSLTQMLQEARSSLECLGEEAAQFDDIWDGHGDSKASSGRAAPAQLMGRAPLAGSAVDFSWPFSRGGRDCHGSFNKKAACTDVCGEVTKHRSEDHVAADKDSAFSLGKLLRRRATERTALVKEVGALRNEARALMEAEEENWQKHVDSYGHLTADVAFLRESVERSRCQWLEHEEKEAACSSRAAAYEAEARAAAAEMSAASAHAQRALGECRSRHERQMVELVESYEAELRGAAVQCAATECGEQRLADRCAAFECELSANQVRLAWLTEQLQARPSTKAMQDVELHCESGEQRLDDMGRRFLAQAERAAGAARFAAAELQEAQVAWAARLEEEDRRRREIGRAHV